MRTLIIFGIILLLAGCKKGAVDPAAESQNSMPDFMEIGSDHLRLEAVGVWADMVIIGDSLGVNIRFEDPPAGLFFDIGDKWDYPRAALVWSRDIYLKNPDTEIFYRRQP